jgi:hypothetical protein
MPLIFSFLDASFHAIAADTPLPPPSPLFSPLSRHFLCRRSMLTPISPLKPLSFASSRAISAAAAELIDISPTFHTPPIMLSQRHCIEIHR